MTRGRKPGTKISPYTSKPYSFRLDDSDKYVHYQNRLDQWIENKVRSGVGKPSYALRDIVIGLIDHFNGEPLSGPDATMVGVQRLKDEIVDDLKLWLRDFLGDSARLTVLAETSRELESRGDDVPDDLVDNILEDFMGMV